MDSQSVEKALKDNSSHPMFNVAGTPPLQEKGVDDAEISIFEAHKYFSEEYNDSKGIKTQQPSHDLLSVQRLPSAKGYAWNFKTKSLRAGATPTASSSRAGLLANPTGLSLKNLAAHCARKRWSAAKKWFFRRICCCSCEKCVRVKEVTSELEHRAGPIVLIDTKKFSNTNSNILHTDGDQSLKQTASDKVVKIHHINTSTDCSSMDAPRLQRISATGRPFIDAFTFPILNSCSDQATTHAGLKAIIAKSTINAREDDVGSDASSDLFEIECFSTQTTHCWWDSVDEDSINARRFALPKGIINVQNCRRIVDEAAPSNAANCSVTTADGTLWPPREEAVGGQGKMNGKTGRC